MDRIRKILSALGVRWNPESAESFRTEEDGAAYQVWKLRTDGGDMVLKKTTPMERQVYETFLADGSFAPQNTMTRAEAAVLLCRLLDKIN